MFPFVKPDYVIPPPLHIKLGPGAQLFEALFEKVASVDSLNLREQNIVELLRTPAQLKLWQTVVSKIDTLKSEIESLSNLKQLYNNNESEEFIYV